MAQRSDFNIKARANEIKEIQINALRNFEISESFIKSVNEIVDTVKNNGLIITTGMGKAGIIAYKMSATLASIGCPSFFVSPAEAAHGDLGRIRQKDLIIIFSHSGKTGEVKNMIQALNQYNQNKNKIIMITGNPKPQIPTDIVVHYGKVEESCVVSKVPSTSTTLMLMVADMIAITASESMGLNDEWFKIRHPGGAIGQSYKKEEKS